MTSVRLRRLVADFEKLKAFVKRQPRVRLIQSEGDPPERYQLEFYVNSLRQVDEELKVINRHLVEITLPRNYPRTPPQCRMLSPIFHPNIAPHAICIGDHWSAGEPLWSMVARIGEMIAYQSYNTKSPLNGEAARWVEQNESRLPLDASAIYVEEPDAPPPSAAPPRTAAPTTAARPAKSPQPASHARPSPVLRSPPPPARGPATPPPPTAAKSGPAATGPKSTTTSRISVECPGCKARYAVQAGSASRVARCRKCQATIVIPPVNPAP